MSWFVNDAGYLTNTGIGVFVGVVVGGGTFFLIMACYAWYIIWTEIWRIK